MELISTKEKSGILNNNILKSFSTKATVENMIITWFYKHEVLRNINHDSNSFFLFLTVCRIFTPISGIIYIIIIYHYCIKEKIF